MSVANPDPEPRFVYAYADLAGEIIYIGCTNNLHKRDGAHRRLMPWWTADLTMIVLSTHTDECESFLAETAAIRKHQPIHNRHGKHTRIAQSGVPATEWRCAPLDAIWCPLCGHCTCGVGAFRSTCALHRADSAHPRRQEMVA